MTSPAGSNLIAISVGNTRTAIGTFIGHELQSSERLVND